MLSEIAGVKVRIITATCHDGTRYGGTRYGGAYRLATTLAGHRAYPAAALVSLYHERWEHEVTYLALRHTLLKGRVLRSGDPAGIEQEMWALLALYQALRTAVTDAAGTVPGTDPDRISYQVAVHAARDTVIQARGIITAEPDLAGHIGRAVLAALHPPRRPRVSQRKVKSVASRWRNPDPARPQANLKITELATTITPHDDRKRTRRTRSLTPAWPP